MGLNMFLRPNDENMYNRTLYAVLRYKKANMFPRGYHYLAPMYTTPYYEPIIPCPKCKPKYKHLDNSHVLTKEHWAILSNTTQEHLSSMLNFINGLPDYRGTNRGYKVLAVRDNWLSSPLFNFEWKPNTVATANCMYVGKKEVVHPDTVPLVHCTCGFYIYWDAFLAINYCDSPNHVVTIVEHGGHTVEHDYGLRAQYAIVRELVPVVGIEIVETLSRIMDIPITEGLLWKGDTYV